MISPLILGVQADKAFRRLMHRMSFEMVRRAFVDVSSLVQNERRKLPSGEPFQPELTFHHLLEVCAWQCISRAPPEVIAAGLHHDTLEDYPDLWPAKRMRKEYGDHVTDLVLVVTKPLCASIRNPERRWHARNEGYEVKLQRARGVPLLRWALGISCADKGSNTGWSIYKMRMGVHPNALMNHPWAWDMERLIRLGRLFRGQVPSGMMAR